MPQSQKPSDNKLIITADSLNVRKSPSPSASVTGSLNRGDIVEWLQSSSDDNWQKIRKDDLLGWSFHSHLALQVEHARTGSLGQIIQIAAGSAISRYDWKDKRGVAPRGYIKGMAVVYARVYCKWKGGDPAVAEMAKADTGDRAKDALAWYSQQFAAAGMNNDAAGADTLRHLFVLMLGLGMRESSGRYCEGLDKDAPQNATAGKAEAGLFQTSYNAKNANPLLPKLFQHYLAQPSGFVEIFQEGVTCKASDIKNYGSGAGKEFQRLSKECPAFAAEFAAVALRNTRAHWGPITSRKAEIRSESNAMFMQVQNAVESSNLCPSVQ
jgi:Bacterial SH3 domain